MSEELNTAPSEAVEEVVAEAAESEATEITEGQVETPPAEEAEAEAQAEEAEDKPAKPSRHQRRKAEMQRLRAERDEALANEKRAQERLARIETAAQASQPPKQEDFANYDDYIAARTAHAAVQTLDAREKQDAEAELQRNRDALSGIEEREQQELAQDWAAQRDEARTRYADFDRVTGNPSLPITEKMFRLIATSDVGADVAYHLGSHPEEAARLASMSDLEMARNIGAIESIVSRPKVKTKTTAPDPVAPVRPKATAAKDPEKMTAAEFAKFRDGGGTVRI